MTNLYVFFSLSQEQNPEVSTKVRVHSRYREKRCNKINQQNLLPHDF